MAMIKDRNLTLHIYNEQISSEMVTSIIYIFWNLKNFKKYLNISKMKKDYETRAFSRN